MAGYCPGVISTQHSDTRELRRQRSRTVRRVLYLVMGVVLLCVVLFRGYGPYYLNLSPGTDSGGPVSIQTNHAQYRAYEPVRITVTNHLHVPIYTAYFPNDVCNIYLVAQVFNNAGDWKAVDHGGSCVPAWTICCRSCSPTPNTVLQINPGTAYLAVWDEGDPYPHDVAGFEIPGTSRILLMYSTDQQTMAELASNRSFSSPLDVPDGYNTHVATSAILQVKADGYQPVGTVACV